MLDADVGTLSHPSDAPLPPARTVGTRHLRPDDLPQICDLYANIFRKGRKVRRAAIVAALEQTYLTSPGDRIQPASLVDLDAGGQVQGFMGIITLSACYGSERLRGGILGNFMAHEANRPRSALRLLRATHALDLDFIFTDTANQTSHDIGRALRYKTLPLQSLEWVKILRPCETASFLVGRRAKRARAVMTPVARLLDHAAHQLPFAVLPKVVSKGIIDRPITAERFAETAPALTKHFKLRPDWSGDEIRWLLAQAALKTRNGPLHIREVATANGETLGLYLLYAKAGAAAHALQILAVRHREPDIYTSIFRTAFDLGAVAVRGTATPNAIENLTHQDGIFYHHVAFSEVYAKRQDLRDAFLATDSCIGGLLGESWTQLSTEAFD